MMFRKPLFMDRFDVQYTTSATTPNHIYRSRCWVPSLPCACGVVAATVEYHVLSLSTTYTTPRASGSAISYATAVAFFCVHTIHMPSPGIYRWSLYQCGATLLLSSLVLYSALPSRCLLSAAFVEYAYISTDNGADASRPPVSV